MLTKKIAGGQGQLPPDMPGTGVMAIPAGVPANQAEFDRQGSHSRRMRRQERAARTSARRARGWSLRLW